MASSSDRDIVTSQTIAVIGEREFNRCITSIPDVKRLGRLRFWQERLINRVLPQLNAVENGYASAFGALDAFILLFDGQALRDFTISKSEFLAEPIEFYADPLCRFDNDWLADALTDQDFREHLYGDVVVALSSDTDLHALAAVHAIRKHLPTALWKECYNFIRHELQVPDVTWRDKFLNAFPESEPHLPKSAT